MEEFNISKYHEAPYLELDNYRAPKGIMGDLRFGEGGELPKRSSIELNRAQDNVSAGARRQAEASRQPGCLVTGTQQ